MKIRVLVTGGRDYKNRTAVFRALDAIEAGNDAHAIVIEGGQRTLVNGKPVCGADFFANEWAAERGRTCVTYYAAWKKHGNSAGPIRNSEMLANSKPHICLVFPGGRGTADMSAKAFAAGVDILDGAKYE